MLFITAVTINYFINSSLPPTRRILFMSFSLSPLTQLLVLVHPSTRSHPPAFYYILFFTIHYIPDISFPRAVYSNAQFQPRADSVPASAIPYILPSSYLSHPIIPIIQPVQYDVCSSKLLFTWHRNTSQQTGPWFFLGHQRKYWGGKYKYIARQICSARSASLYHLTTQILLKFVVWVWVCVCIQQTKHYSHTVIRTFCT